MIFVCIVLSKRQPVTCIILFGSDASKLKKIRSRHIMAESAKKEYTVPEMEAEQLETEEFVLQNSIEGVPEDDPFVY